MIELQHISKHFGKIAALDDVSLTIKPGDRLALIGENGAGKSSLMNVLYGLYQPDAGEVLFDGTAVRLNTPADALAQAIGMVQQHFTLVPTLSVTENVILGREPTRWGTIDLRRANQEVASTCAKFGFDLDPSARVSTLSVGSQQKVEIIKALHRGAKTLILDEPTAVLTPQEAEELFAVTKRLCDGGLAVVLISHKLREVFAFATRIAVMRRGRKISEPIPAETSPQLLAEMMVEGPSIQQRAPVEEVGRGRAVLTLTNLCAAPLHDVSFSIHRGEIVGIAGVDGNGQHELAEVLTGLRPWSSGTLTFEEHSLSALNPRQARLLGIAHIPEDRLRRAIVSDLSLEENVSLGRQHEPPFARGARIDFKSRRAVTQSLLDAHDVRPAIPHARVGTLSGGNQQKLVVGRELMGSPKVLVAAQPTRGLDLHAVAAVREKLIQQRASGCAMVLLSLDLDEVLELADRIIVLHGGKVMGQFDRAQFDERRIGRQMLGLTDA